MKAYYKPSIARLTRRNGIIVIRGGMKGKGSELFSCADDALASKLVCDWCNRNKGSWYVADFNYERQDF